MPRTIRAESEHDAEVAVSVWCTNTILRAGAYDGCARRIDSSACHPARVTIAGRPATAGLTVPRAGDPTRGLVMNVTARSRTSPFRRMRTRRAGPVQTGASCDSSTHRVHVPLVRLAWSRTVPAPFQRTPTIWNVRPACTALPNGWARCGTGASRTPPPARALGAAARTPRITTAAHAARPPTPTRHYRSHHKSLRIPPVRFL